MIRRPPRSTQSRSSAASDVYKRQLSFSTTLLYNAAMGVSVCRRLADCGLAADLEAHKPRDYDVLAGLGNHRLDELLDRLALITDVRLMHQTVLFIVRSQLAIDDLLPDLLRLLLRLELNAVETLLMLDDVRRNVLRTNEGRIRGGDLYRNLLAQTLEIPGLGDEIGLAVQLDQDAQLATSVYIGCLLYTSDAADDLL